MDYLGNNKCLLNANDSRKKEKLDGNSDDSNKSSEMKVAKSINDLFTNAELKKLFSYFTLRELLRLQLVCKRWRTVILQMMLTVKELVFVFEKEADDYVGIYDDKYMISVLNAEEIIFIVNRCKFVEKVSLFGCKFKSSKKYVYEAIGNVRRLKSLTLYDCTIQDEDIISLVKRQPSLESIRLRCDQLTDIAFECVKDTCLNLKSIYFSFNTLKPLSTPFKQTLTAFGLICYYPSFIDGETLVDCCSAIANNSETSLERVTLSVGEHIDCIECIARFKNLKCIQLELNNSFDQKWRFNYWQKLEIIDICALYTPTNFDDDDLLSIADDCPRLKVLSLKWIPVMRYTTTRRLHTYYAKPLLISDKSVTQLSSKLLDLRVLILQGAKQITNASIESFHGIAKLEQLQVHDCPEVSDQCFASFIRRKRSLRVIAVSSTDRFRMTRDAFKQVAKEQPKYKFYAHLFCLVESENECTSHTTIIDNLTLFEVDGIDLSFPFTGMWYNFFDIRVWRVNDYFSWKDR
ncbi:hypothetical protein B4U79_16131 [Dinothrombium tinctorium]|uniref:F-box domain-containing protein n=1 Tax=Dinothrombium tinctorium TaxID=1965070 RepID=A0A3S3P8J4_9ACAR|nr:hypothetical protein B4U79_16131 [Dinothrombium tinctorium]